MSYYSYQQRLSIITEDQLDRIIAHTQADPSTDFRIICFCGRRPSGRLMLWTGPDHWVGHFGLISA